MIRALWRRVRPGGAAPRAVPVPEPEAPVEPSPFDAGFPPAPAERIERLTECPVCGSSSSSPAVTFNKLILYPHPPDAASYRYEYGMCHECGVVSARLRPAGPRYAWMVEHFEETLGRVGFGEERPAKLVLTSDPMTDEKRAHLRSLASKGVFVSDHSGLTRKEYLPALMADRLSNSVHVELLGSLLPLRAPRVLEIRSRLGSISAGLQRLYDATPFTMAMFPSQQFLIEEVYKLPSAMGIDYDHFEVPFEGTFDLIIANHLLTHALRPRDMLATLHDRLTPGGHLYVFNEPDEAEFTGPTAKSIFNTLNAFHMQAFDGASVVRMLEANGFHVIFSTLYNGNTICLAQKRERTSDWARIPDAALERRQQAYAHAARMAAILIPPFARGRLDESWDDLLAQGLKDGVVEMNRKGNLKARREGEQSK